MICEKCNGEGIIHKGLDYVCDKCGGLGKTMEEEKDLQPVVEESDVVEEESFLEESGEESEILSPDNE